MSAKALQHQCHKQKRGIPPASSFIEQVPLGHLRPNPRNARTHSKKQIYQIAESIQRFGAISPLIVDGHDRIIAGHGRAEAAKLIGLKLVPVIRLDHLTEPEIRAYALVDNKLAENAGWDRELLSMELGELQLALPDHGLEIGITGFEPAEIDLLAKDFEQDRNDPVDAVPEPAKSATAKLGDVFLLGQHRLIVGDACDANVYARLMQSETALMAFHDPPYNVRVNGHVGGRGRTKHREFNQTSGEMTSDQFTEFLQQGLGQAAGHMIDGGISYVCMDWQHAGELFAAGNAVFDELKNVCVWAKTTPGQGSFYRSQHELVFVFKTGKASHLNTFELGQHGRSRSNLWTYAGANTFRAGRMTELRMHPTVKPVALVADAMKDCSRRGSIVLDAFAGSGTTIMAAEQVGRRAFCIEIDPLYVDVAVRRWQSATRKDAILESEKYTFDELCTVRNSKSLPSRKTCRRKR